MARITLALGAAHNIRPRSQKVHSADQHQFTFLLLNLHLLFIHLPHDRTPFDPDHVTVLSFSLELATLFLQFSNLCLDVLIASRLPAFTVWLNNQCQRANMDRVGFILIELEHFTPLNDSGPTV
jgi:hypothetical protein